MLMGSSSDTIEMLSRMAVEWNIPTIGYFSSKGFLRDKTIYKTLARVSMTMSNGISDSLVSAIIINDHDISVSCPHCIVGINIVYLLISCDSHLIALVI